MVATCMKCLKDFSNGSNMRRHLKEKHRSQEDINALNRFACEQCERKFKRREHLQTHMNAVHSQGSQLYCDQCNYKTIFKQVLARHISSHYRKKHCSDIGRSQVNYRCNLCPNIYKRKSSLNYHIKLKHDIKCMSFKTYEKTCPLCALTKCHAVAHHTVKSMLEHFEKTHGLKMEYEKLNFQSICEFKKWKSDLENESISRYIAIRTSKNYLRFTCHRSGTFISKSCGKRSMKISGTSKINGFCPASMTVNISDSGEVKVLFLKSHVGHTNEHKFVNLSQTDKENIAISIASKIPYEEILRRIRRDVTDGKLKRIHLITRKDLINIAKSFNLDGNS